MENWWPKNARFNRETKKKNQFVVCPWQTDRQTDGQTDRVNDKKIIDSYSWAQRSIVCSLSEKYEKSRIIVLLCCQSEGNIFIYWSTTSAVRYKNVNRLTLYRGQNNKSVAYRLLAAIAKIVIWSKEMSLKSTGNALPTKWYHVQL